MEEPSVLDFLKSLLMPWKGNRIHIPAADPDRAAEMAVDEGESEEIDYEPPVEEPQAELIEDLVPTEEAVLVPAPEAVTHRKPQKYRWPWRSLLVLVLVVFAQTVLEPPAKNAVLGAIGYALAAALLVWAILSREWEMPDLAEDAPEPMSTEIRWPLVGIAALFVVAAFLTFVSNRFTATNLTIGLIALFYTIIAFYYSRRKPRGIPFWKEWSRSLDRLVRSKPKISVWVLLIAAAVVGLAVFYRFYRLNGVPGEMFSDHAEKLLDVMDVLDGRTSIFFPRNTGREAIQFYLTAGIINLLGTGVSFISLKLGTALIGLLTLPYMYLLGKEIGGKWVGLLTVIMAAMGYWPNLIARIGLRFPLYPAFTAPALYYLIRGLRRMNRNDFIWSGLFLGLGLHGYTPMRIVPFVFVILILIYLAHRQAAGKRKSVLVGFAILAVISVVVLTPLIRYALEDQMNMEYFTTRALSRLGPEEKPLPSSPLLIFVRNFWNAWVMPFWNNGDIWVHSVVNRPALDVVTAGLYFLGSVMVFIRYLRRRHWLDLFLLVLVPLLMLPSILSLAFPGENPSLNRTGAAYIPIFILAAIGLDGLFKALRGRSGSRLGLAVAAIAGAMLFTGSASQNFDLVFNQYDQQFMRAAWNTSQIGEVIREFATTIGTPDTAFVVPYPYWIDTRLVGINAGYPRKDYAIQRVNLAKTSAIEGPKLFIFKPEDNQTLEELRLLYPNGIIQTFKGDYDGRDFMIFMVLS